MGIDYLDLMFRIESEFQLCMTHVDVEKQVQDRSPADLTAGDTLAFILSQPTCLSCGYSLRGHGAEGICPECGKSFAFDQDATWTKLQRLLGEVMGIDRNRISKESRLSKDLGFT